MGIDSETGKVLRPAAWGEQSMQLSTSFGKPSAVTASEFAKAVTPALTLVSPTGMTQDERKSWLHAAYKALGDIPADKLESAVSDAMKTCDHPSKIVPAIRKALDSGYKFTATIGQGCGHFQPRIETDQSRAQTKEMAELMRGLRKRLEANSASDAA